MRIRAPKERRKRHILVRLLRTTLALLAGLLLVAILAIVLLPTIVSTEYVTRLVERETSTTLGRDLRIEQIDWSWRKGFMLKGLAVPDLPGFSGGDVIGAKEVFLDIPLGQLIKGSPLVIMSLTGLTLDLVKDTNGNVNVASLAPTSPPQHTETVTTGTSTEEASAEKSVSMNIVLDADIRDLDFRFEDRTQDMLILARGNLGTQLAVQGRTPRTDDLESITDPPSFMERLLVRFSVSEIGIDVTLPDKSRILVDDISMRKPFEYVFTGRTGRGSVACELGVSGIRELPGIEFVGPVSISASIDGEHEWIDSFSVSQDLQIIPMGVSQELNIAAHGLAGALKYLPDRPLHMLKTVGATFEAAVTLSETNSISRIFPVAEIEGGIGLGCSAKLVPGRSILVTISATSPGIDVDVDSVVSIEKLGADLAIERTLVLDFVDTRDNERDATTAPLSQSVFDTARSSSAIPTPGSGVLAMQRRIADMHRMLAPSHSLSIGSIQARATPLPLTISNLAIDIDLQDNLPVMELLQFDLLGGTLTANAGLLRKKGRYHVDANVQFSGISTGMIVADPGNDSSAHDSELSGSLEFSMPIDTDITAVIADMKAVVNISHIGSRTLERLLYALDPSGSDETIVAQRRLLKRGSPKWVRIALRDGAMSLQGEVNLLGTTIALPSLERLNVSELSLVKQYGDGLGQLAPAITALDTLSAASLRIQPDGRISITR